MVLLLRGMFEYFDYVHDRVFDYLYGSICQGCGSGLQGYCYFKCKIIFKKFYKNFKFKKILNFFQILAIFNRKRSRSIPTRTCCSSIHYYLRINLDDFHHWPLDLS